MNKAAGAELAAAVTNSGGLGVIGGLNYTSKMLRSVIKNLNFNNYKGFKIAFATMHAKTVLTQILSEKLQFKNIDVISLVVLSLLGLDMGSALSSKKASCKYSNS